MQSAAHDALVSVFQETNVRKSLMLFKLILIEIIKHRVHHLEIMNVDVNYKIWPACGFPVKKKYICRWDILVMPDRSW